MQTQNPETSIVVRTYNEERWLPEVFKALDKQSYRNFEVLVVDSGSVDRTRDIAAENGARIVRLRSEDFTFGHSLNVGIEEAKGSFIAIISAHAIPADEHWLKCLVEPLRDEKVAMVYGGQRGHEISKYSETRDFERIFPSDKRFVIKDEDDAFANNANSAIRRDLWEKHEFDEGLPGLEDIEFAKFWIEQQLEVVYEPDACIIHVHTETWPQVRNRYHREGMAARWVGIKILRHIPGELWRELKWCCKDLWLAVTEGKLKTLAKEIIRFRYEKTVGTLGGIVDSRGIDNPARRAEMYFQKGFPALVIKGPHRAYLEERSVPSLKPGELLVRVSHVGVCGTDLEIYDGSLGYYKSGFAEYPIVPGHESSGTVVAVGPRVTDLEKGDQVVVECIQGCGECEECGRDEAIRCKERREVGVIGHDGACATYLVSRARYVHRIPETVPLAKAALVEPLAVVLKGLGRLGVKNNNNISNQKCFVVGAGTIGQLAARVLKERGYDVTVIDRNMDRLKLLPTGIETSSSFDGVEESEFVIEATGNKSLLNALMEKLSTGSTLLLLGLPYGKHSFNFESIVAFDRTIVGSVGSNGTVFKEALEILPQLDVEPFVQHSYPLEKYEEAWSLARSGKVLKVMLRLDD